MSNVFDRVWHAFLNEVLVERSASQKREIYIRSFSKHTNEKIIEAQKHNISHQKALKCIAKKVDLNSIQIICSTVPRLLEYRI